MPSDDFLCGGEPRFNTETTETCTGGLKVALPPSALCELCDGILIVALTSATQAKNVPTISIPGLASYFTIEITVAVHG